MSSHTCIFKQHPYSQLLCNKKHTETNMKEKIGANPAVPLLATAIMSQRGPNKNHALSQPYR
jgi:hypothetical protein